LHPASAIRRYVGFSFRISPSLSQCSPHTHLFFAAALFFSSPLSRISVLVLALPGCSAGLLVHLWLRLDGPFFQYFPLTQMLFFSFAFGSVCPTPRLLCSRWLRQIYCPIAFRKTSSIFFFSFFFFSFLFFCFSFVVLCPLFFCFSSFF